VQLGQLQLVKCHLLGVLCRLLGVLHCLLGEGLLLLERLVAMEVVVVLVESCYQQW
jgi:hypothetical protein